MKVAQGEVAKVSVVVPIFNTGRVALAVLEELWREEYGNLEIICVDDGSDDDSLMVLEEFAEKKLAEGEKLAKKGILREIKIVSQKNSGPSGARNAGINISSGAYLLFVDSDDRIKTGLVSELVMAMSEVGVDLAVTGVEYYQVATRQSSKIFVNPVRKQGQEESKVAYILRLLLTDGRFYAVHNKIYRGEIIRQNRVRFDVDFRFAEDLKFNLEYIKYASGDIKFLRKALYQYNYGTPTSLVRGSSLVRANWQKSFRHLRGWVREVGIKERQGWLNEGSGDNHPTTAKKERQSRLSGGNRGGKEEVSPKIKGAEPRRAGGGLGMIPWRERWLLGKVWLRWKISHANAVMRVCPKWRSRLRRVAPWWLILTAIANLGRNLRRK